MKAEEGENLDYGSQNSKEDFLSAERGLCMALECYRCFCRNLDEVKGKGVVMSHDTEDFEKE